MRLRANRVVGVLVLGVAMLVPAGCGDMDRATLQDKIQSHLNRDRYLVAAVHCEKTDSDVADYLCITQGANGEDGIGMSVWVDGDDWGVVTTCYVSGDDCLSPDK